MKSIRFEIQLALLTLAAVLGAGSAFAEQEFREEFHQTYPLEKQGRVQLANVNGHVRVVTWDREEVKVDAVKHAQKQEQLGQIKIEVDTHPNRLQIKTKLADSKLPRNGSDSRSVEYTLTVPQQCHLHKISTVNGGVQIENVAGDVEAKSVNGPVTATGLLREVDLSSVNGSVKATFAAVEKEISLKSVNGSVTIALPAQANADVSANTLNGGITTEFSLSTKAHFPIGRNLKGKLGDGGPAIKMSSVNGGIRIDRAEVTAVEKP